MSLKKMDINNLLSYGNKNKSGDNHSNSSSKISSKIKVESVNNLINANISLFISRTNYELMYEAFYISNLFYKMTQTKYHIKDTFFYLLNLEWFSKWKKYVNYDYYTNIKNRKKFISINKLPFRPSDINNNNYMKNIGTNTKKKICDFFDKFFLADNALLYPGHINNKKFLVDKNQNASYFYSQHLENNFNIINDIKYNEQYIWVTEDIWKYFYSIYGGFEIRRRNLNNNNNYEMYLNNDNNDNDIVNINNKNERILEAKYKTFNLILFHFKKNYSYKIDPPKYLFLSHCDTIYDFKKKVKNLFPFLSKISIEEIHLFYLNKNMNLNDFSNYVKINSNNKQEKMVFPGFCLDSLDSHLTIEFFEEKYLKINDNNIINNIVLEVPFYLKEKNMKIYLFETQNIKLNETMDNINYNKPYYDKITINEIEGQNDFIINEKLFLIKKFFYQKYFIDKINQYQKNELNIHLKKIIDNFNDEQIKKIFNIELDELRNNMDLIFDKNFLAEKIPNLYLNEFDKNEKKENNNLLNKKRERENKEIILSESNDESSEISWYTCDYCNRTLNNQNYTTCKFCLRTKYCHDSCRRHGIKKHLLRCGK